MRTYGSISTLEALELSICEGELLGWDDGGQDLAGDVPELIVGIAEEEDVACGLGVEGGGDVEDGFLDDFLDAGVWDGRLFLELVNCAAALDRLEELLGCHFGSGGGSVGVGGSGSEFFALSLLE